MYLESLINIIFKSNDTTFISHLVIILYFLFYHKKLLSSSSLNSSFILHIQSLWKIHNRKFCEASNTTLTSIITRANDRPNEWSWMQRTRLSLQEDEAFHNWSKRLTGVIKCNVDAAAFNNNANMWYGMCFSDSTWLLLLGKSDYFDSSAIVLEAEIINLLEAIKVAISNEIHVVLFETNCKTLSDAISSTKVPLNEFEGLVF